MAQDLTSPYLDMWLDYEPEVYVERKNATTGVWEPAAGLTGCEFRIADDEQGTAIGALTGIAATERSAAPGHYAGAIDLAVLTSELDEPTYPHGEEVFLQFWKAGDVQAESFRKQIRRTKYASR